MGTNYYAEWSFGSSAHGPARLKVEPVVIELHICKSLSSFQGAVFDSWAAWKNFFLHNGSYITIRDEYGNAHEADKFITDVEKVPMENRRRQYDWVCRNGRIGSTEWLDGDGFSFYAGEFS